MTTDKLTRQGRLVSVQPRIRLLRSFDERSHSYLGYVLQIDRVIGSEERMFTVGIGKQIVELWTAISTWAGRSSVCIGSLPVIDKHRRLPPIALWTAGKFVRLSY